MKNQKVTSIIIFFGIFLIISGVVIGKAANSKLIEANGYFGMEKLTITQKNNSGPNDVIHLEDMERLKNVLGNPNLTYSSSLKTTIEENKHTSSVEIIGTNSLYPKFNNVNFSSGSFFTENAQIENRRVAVIDEKLALELFNTSQVLGKEIRLFGNNFVIIGVIAANESLMHTLIDDGIPSIYIPCSTYMELNAAAVITHVELKTADNSTFGDNAKLFKEGLQAIGKNPENYIITDFNVEEALIKERPDLLVFLAGVISILILLVYLKGELVALIREIILDTKTYYLLDAIRSNGLRIIMLLVKAGVISFLAIVLRRLAKFNLYIPPQYIPDDLTDIGYFVDQIKNSIFETNSNLGYIASKSEQILIASQNIVNISFTVSLLPGFAIFYIGLYQAKVLKIDLNRLFLIGGISFLIATTIIIGLLVYLGMAFYINIAFLAILWVFICLNCIRITRSDDRDKPGL